MASARPPAMPTLADVAARPELADHLPGSTAGLLALEATALVLRLTVRAVVAPPRLASDAPDTTLTTRQAAEMLGMRVITLHHKAHQDPWRTLRVDNGTRLLRWSRRRIEAFLATPVPRVGSVEPYAPAEEPPTRFLPIPPNRRRRPKEV
jgi:hypothetical protein